MKAVILAGGLGTRISEETHLKPKPMIEVGGLPIIWHILKIYSTHEINEFIICCGYKGYMIKEYFANYFMHTSDVTINTKLNSIEIHRKKTEPWIITLVDTGETSMTGGRLKRVKDYIGNDTFCLTYGDGVADIDIRKLIVHHRMWNRLATLTAVQPPGRYGALKIGENSAVTSFQEKPQGDGGWINGGFFVLEPEVIDRIEGDEIVWEQEPLWSLAADKQLSVYQHTGFWQPMDTLRDRIYLEKLWTEGNAAWKIW